MENEFMKRGYLLPEGCKDLSDVARLKQKQAAAAFLQKALQKLPLDNTTAHYWVKSAAPVSRQVFIPSNTTPDTLATLLGLKPFQIISDLMKLGEFATIHQSLDFISISKVAKMHGFLAIKAGL